jgi:hypothetical protein
VGRDVGCALRFNDPAVSRRHLRFVRRADDVFLEDLGSSNGTVLNGRAVTGPIRVLSGDRVNVGTRELVIRIPAAGEGEPATINLKDLSAAADVKSHVRATTQLSPAAVTEPIRVADVLRHANQRCPQCGAAVSAEDEECASCHYAWGNFRAKAATVRPNNQLNRRRHERSNIELHLVYSSSELEIEATTRDLSASGVFVCTQVLDPLGTICNLTILVDGGPPLKIRGTVRRVVEHEENNDDAVGLGIEFLEVGAPERAWLNRVIMQQRRRAGA